MRPLALIIVLAIAFTGCNNLNDLRPEDPNKVIPQMVVNVVKDKFPKGEDLVFKPVLEDRIWEVKLKSDADHYSSLVDHGKMWETFKVMPDGVPSTLQEPLKKTALGDGVLSAYSTAYFATTAKNKLIYNYKGENYSFRWEGVNPNSNSSAAFDPILYRITTYEINDLPGFVKDTIAAIPDLGFVMGYTWVRMDDTKRYHVFTRRRIGNQFETVSMLFDDKGKLRWSSTFFSSLGNLNTNSNLEMVPAEIKQQLDSLPELTGYEFEKKLINNVNGLTSYYITVAVGSVSRCEFYFDKDFNVLNKTYIVLLYQ
jgi:hypothetical protein